MLSPTQLAQSSHIPTYASYPPIAAVPQDSPLKTIQCPETGCNKQFTDIEGYRIHASTEHGGERRPTEGNQQSSESRPYVCDHLGCGKAFKQYGNLKTHVRKHTGERPYQCTFDGCGKNFAQLGNLKTHEKIHWPVKPYVCDYPDCHRGFTQRGNLKAHLIKVHHISTS
ncbi:hypothetical protein BC941DRAFT_432803 [Chlamydoabsidia padenii]|nr:hypothetical protein BC941DRAFT_432803 [Chlamydoabsidia padenii]